MFTQRLNNDNIIYLELKKTCDRILATVHGRKLAQIGLLASSLRSYYRTAIKETNLQ